MTPAALTKDLDPQFDARLEPVYQLAESCQYEAPHAHQVARLALRLFDDLADLHELDDQRRFWLTCAGLLHDVGWIHGGAGHHKMSMKIILESDLLPWDRRDRMIIGSIARYHRRAVPSTQHKHYADLDATGRDDVSRLASLLRIADALDRTHRAVVHDLHTDVHDDAAHITYHAANPANAEATKAQDKADLFELTYNRSVHVQWARP